MGVQAGLAIAVARDTIILMEQFIAKLTDYNLFNYLLPGVLFMMFAPQVRGVHLIELQSTYLLPSLFLAYFLGMIISRIGSLVVQPVLRFLRIVKFVPHKEYLAASEKDTKIDVLSSENNTYRTFVALFASLLLAYALAPLLNSPDLSAFTLTQWLFMSLFVLFVWAYSKQTSYITSRVKRILNKK